jgi:hypothetical protein
MASQTRLTDLVVNGQADLWLLCWTAASVDVMTGRQPATGDEKITSQTALVSLQFNNPAFMPAVGGIIKAYPITPGIAVALGDATVPRLSIRSQDGCVRWVCRAHRIQTWCSHRRFSQG